MNIITSAENRLKQQIDIFQKTLEKQLQQKVVELQINQKRITGIMGIKQICMRIMNDEHLIELKNIDSNEFDKRVDNEFDKQWQMEIESIKNQISSNQMINQQFQTIFSQLRQKQKAISTLPFDISYYQDIESQILKMLSKNQGPNNNQILAKKYKLDSNYLQIVES